MTKFDLDTLKSLFKSMFDHWRKATKTETNTMDQKEQGRKEPNVTKK